MVGKGGLAAIVVVFGTGVWLIAAPWVVRYQPAGAPLTGAARSGIVVGSVLATAGFAGFFIVLASRVRELYAKAPCPDCPDQGGIRAEQVSSIG